MLLSNLTAQSSKEGGQKQTKLQSRGYKGDEVRMKLKADMIAKVLSPEYLSDLSGNLVEAELAMRNDDSEKLCHINYAIANIFEKSGDYHKAVYYLSRSLMNSKRAENRVHEAKVKFSLGKVYVKLGDCFNAITWFEEYLQFARDSQNNESLVLGSKQLLEVYQMSAKDARCKGRLEKSIDLFQKSIQMAEICSDSRAKAEAKYEIGLLHQMQFHLDLALQYQTDYLVFCCSEKDQAGACCKLGMMYNKQHLYEKALLYFEMFFKLACTLKNPKLIDAARLNLGYVKNILHNSDGPCSMQQLT